MPGDEKIIDNETAVETVEKAATPAENIDDDPAALRKQWLEMEGKDDDLPETEPEPEKELAEKAEAEVIEIEPEKPEENLKPEAEEDLKVSEAIAAKLKALNVPYKDLEEFAAKHKSIADESAQQFSMLNNAANKHPQLLAKFYRDLAIAQAKEKGLPIPDDIGDERKPAEVAVNDRAAVYKIFEGKINPKTDEAFTKQEVDDYIDAQKIVNQVANKELGLVTREELNREKTATRIKDDTEKAVKDIKAFNEAWKDKINNAGGNYDKAMAHMSNYLFEEYGITKDKVHEITPRRLAKALQDYQFSNPDILKNMLTNAKAEGAKEVVTKIGKGRVLPAKDQARPGELDVDKRLEQLGLKVDSGATLSDKELKEYRDLIVKREAGRV